MSKPPLPSEAVELLKRPNAAVIATVRSDGAPVSTPTWYLWEDDRVLISMDVGRVRLKHLRRDPRVTLTVLDGEDWYTHVTLLGQATDMADDENLADIDRISRHYTGEPYPNRERPRVSAWIDIERWHGWGALKDNSQSG
ncbi:PPOX class F420-dependent oxidoreductase [Streptomyces sp. NPDC006285]|uniref:PPOX class F420-dependent oxidoreductase n=1 Tax=Streptomyces sp. NPDC006285 TaxID=3364742 RepID=UPI0036D1EE52